jgi:predicted RNA-binding protein with PIN domain
VPNLLIIDGYNAIHALPSLRSRLDRGLEYAREGLAALIREWKSQRPSWEVVIVYDGQRSSAERGVSGIQAVFTHSKMEADERIREMVRKQAPRSETIVITRDREILSSCRAHGVCFESPDFLIRKSRETQRRAAAKDESIPDKDRKEISDWYRDALRDKGSL